MRLVWIAVIAMLLCFLSLSATLAQSSVAPAPAAQSVSAGTKIAEGTAVELELQDELKSGDVQVGSTVHFTVVRDVSNGAGVLIPAGAPAYGTVTQSKRSGFLGQPGKLGFTCDYVVLPSGVQVPLRAKELSNHGGDSRGASIATAILFTPLTLFARGGNAKAHKGQQFTMYVDHDTVVSQAAPTAATAPAQPSVAKSLFVLASGGQVVGSLTSFDGQSYVVATDMGTMTFKASDVKAVYAITNNIAPAPAAPAPAAPAPAAPATTATLATATVPAPTPPPATSSASPAQNTAPPATPTAKAASSGAVPPAAPAAVAAPPAPAIDPTVVGAGKHVIVAVSDGNSYYGTVTKLDSGVYTLSTHQGDVQVKASDIKSVQYPEK